MKYLEDDGWWPKLYDLTVSCPLCRLSFGLQTMCCTSETCDARYGIEGRFEMSVLVKEIMEAIDRSYVSCGTQSYSSTESIGDIIGRSMQHLVEKVEILGEVSVWLSQFTILPHDLEARHRDFDVAAIMVQEPVASQ